MNVGAVAVAKRPAEAQAAVGAAKRARTGAGGGCINGLMQRLFPQIKPSEVSDYYHQYLSDHQIIELKRGLKISSEICIDLISEQDKFVYISTKFEKALSSILEYNDGKWTLVEFNKGLVEQLCVGSEQEKVNAALNLGVLALNDENQSRIGTHVGAIDGLVKLLHSDSDQARVNAARALGNLAFNDENESRIEPMKELYMDG
jgi:Armadillo/beta-catenin-like repeat.